MRLKLSGNLEQILLMFENKVEKSSCEYEEDFQIDFFFHLLVLDSLFSEPTSHRSPGTTGGAADESSQESSAGFWTPI